MRGGMFAKRTLGSRCEKQEGRVSINRACGYPPGGLTGCAVNRSYVSERSTVQCGSLGDPDYFQIIYKEYHNDLKMPAE